MAFGWSEGIRMKVVSIRELGGESVWSLPHRYACSHHTMLRRQWIPLISILYHSLPQSEPFIPRLPMVHSPSAASETGGWDRLCVRDVSPRWDVSHLRGCEDDCAVIVAVIYWTLLSCGVLPRCLVAAGTMTQ